MPDETHELSVLPSADALGLETRPTRPLCHYTTQDGLIGILKSKSMYASDATFLNDSQEVVYAFNLAKKYFRNRRDKDLRFEMEMMDILDKLESDAGELPVYVASFSEEPDLLSQWRGYCSKGPGFSLCFSADRMTRLATHQWWLVKCVYDIDQQVEMLRKMEEEVMSSYDAEKAMLSVQGNLAVNVHFFGTAFKHPKFSEEKEWRAIKGGGRSSIRPGTSTLIPYANFPLAFDSKDRVELRRLVVGPTPHASLGIKAAQMLLEQTKTVCPEVVSSEIPFRNW